MCAIGIERAESDSRLRGARGHTVANSRWVEIYAQAVATALRIMPEILSLAIESYIQIGAGFIAGFIAGSNRGDSGAVNKTGASDSERRRNNEQDTGDPVTELTICANQKSPSEIRCSGPRRFSFIVVNEELV